MKRSITQSVTMVTQRMTSPGTVLVVALGLLLVAAAGALPSAVLLEGSGDYDYDYSEEPVSSSNPLMKITSDDDVLDPIEDSLYPEDDDEYGTSSNESLAMPPVEIVVAEVESDGEASPEITEENATVVQPVRFGLLESFETDGNVTEVKHPIANGARGDLAVTPAPDCRGFQVNKHSICRKCYNKIVH